MKHQGLVTSPRIAQALAVGSFVWTVVACSGGSGGAEGWGTPGAGAGWAGGLGGGSDNSSSGFSGSSNGIGPSSSGLGSSSGQISGSSSGSSGFPSSSGTSGSYVSGTPMSGDLTLAGSTGMACGGSSECPCSVTSATTGGLALLCGECPNLPANQQCQYCVEDDYCPADLCSGTSTCATTTSSCPASSTDCGTVCCPDGYPVCCPDGVSCATDSTACPSALGSSSSSSGFGTSSGGSSCPSGTWSLSIQTPNTCGACSAGADLNVTVTVSAAVAASGGTFKDSDGVSWTYDPTTCTATQSSSCSQAGSLDFINDEATCYFFCAGGCPGCAESCTLTAGSVSSGSSGGSASSSSSGGFVAVDAGTSSAACESLQACCVTLGETASNTPCEEIVIEGNASDCASVLTGLQGMSLCAP